MFDEFTRAFYQSDVLVVLPIYAASEAPIEGVTGKALYEEIRRHGHKDVRYVESKKAAAECLQEMVEPEDLVLTLGAGDVYRVGEDLAYGAYGTTGSVRCVHAASYHFGGGGAGGCGRNARR